MEGPGVLVAPGAYDAITARAVESAGFDAVYMTGAGTAATLGFPDYGLIGMTEMGENLGRISGAVTIPVVADADTGYGNELNVTRTVREYIARGAAGLHIEDQVFPKRCGHLSDKQVIPTADFVSKIEAAVAARERAGLVIIARTDARAVHGLAEAVDRANRALAAGADMAFVEAPLDLDEVRAVPAMVNGPCLLNMVHGGRTPLMAVEEAAGAGYRMVILPTLLLGAVVTAVEEALVALRRTGTAPEETAPLSIEELFARFGASEWDRVRSRFPGR